MGGSTGNHKTLDLDALNGLNRMPVFADSIGDLSGWLTDLGVEYESDI